MFAYSVGIIAGVHESEIVKKLSITYTFLHLSKLHFSYQFMLFRHQSGPYFRVWVRRMGGGMFPKVDLTDVITRNSGANTEVEVKSFLRSQT